MVIDAPLDDETIYRRTGAGQRMALRDRSPLGDDAERLLLIVNGYTPLRPLLDRIGGPRHSAAMVRDLVTQGLIEPAH